MAITKAIEITKIEVVGTWNIQVATDTVIKEDGTEISRSRHRHVLQPCSSSKDSDINSNPNTNSVSYQLAIFISGILFSIHHQSELAFLPLCILGWLWAIIYTKSGNLWTTILIHSMWNSRIFIGGWFGL